MTGAYKRFTPDEKNFIKEYAPGHSRAEITEALNNKFGMNRSLTSVDNFIQSNKIRTGYKKGHQYTKDELNFLKEYAPGKYIADIRKKFNEKFHSNVSETALLGYMSKNNIRSDISRYKKGRKSEKASPVGTETKHYKYVNVKTKDGWNLKQRVLYEKAYGKIPENSVVIFLDGNSDNFDIDNLMAIDKRINVIMNKYKLPRNSKEQTIASIQTATLIAGIIDAKERVKEKKT